MVTAILNRSFDKPQIQGLVLISLDKGIIIVVYNECYAKTTPTSIIKMVPTTYNDCCLFVTVVFVFLGVSFECLRGPNFAIKN